MSLKVWIPGTNGTLKNQGLLQLPSPSYNATSEATSGKLGKAIQGQVCYHLSSDPCSSLWSVTCWSKFTSGYATYNNIILCLNTADSEDSKFYLSIINNTTLNIGRGASGTVSYNLPGNFLVNIWYHLAATFDGTTTKLYLNGSLVNSSTGGSTKSALNLTIGGRSTNSNGTATTGAGWATNDVRIYDHCLTPQEVKEISKGLVCHYTLGSADVYEATTNIGSNDWYTYEPYWNNKSGSYGNWQLTKNNGSQTLAFSNSTIANTMAAGQIWTLSGFLYKNGVPYKTSISNPSTYSGYSILSWESRNDGYFRYTMYINSVPGWLIHSEMFGNNNAQGSVVLIKLLQFELKNHATHFTATSRNTGLVYDSSGYCNNGTISGTVSPCTSVRYDKGIDCSSNGKVLTNSFVMSNFGNSYSISWWAKGSSASQQMMIGFTNGNRMNVMHTLCLNTGDSQSNPFYKPGTTTQISCPSTTKWHHYTLTGDGSSSKLYVDGVHYGTAKYYRAITGTQICINGWDTSNNYNFNGLYSDFRVYATVLSADDVKDLYNLGALIS